MAPEPLGPQRKPNRRKPDRPRANRTRPAQPTSGNRSAEPRGQQGHTLGQAGDLWWLDGAARYSQAFGNENSMYEQGYHDGVDIAVPVGSGVAALTSGEVVFAGNAGADGYRVGIRQPNGQVYYYGHLGKIDVQVGDRVGRGQIVARSGNTGRSSGPHVHFELDRDTNGVGDSPQKFLSKWGGGTIADTQNGKGGSGKTYAKGGKGDGLADDSQTADYGWAEAVFNSNPELADLLKQGKANDWDQTTMQAAIRGTDWYREHSATWRKMWVLKRDQPETFEQERASVRSSVDAIANQLGVDVTEEERNKIARDAMWLGLSEGEMNTAIGEKFNAQGDFRGSAGDIQDEIMKMAADYGVRVSDTYIQGLVRGVLTNKQTPQDAQNHIMELAKSTYAALSPQLDAGMTTREVADPYVRSMAQLLEIPDTKVDLFDPTVRAALTGRDEKGSPMVTPIHKFEEGIRKDPRWLQTNNARDSLLSKGNALLKMWGLG